MSEIASAQNGSVLVAEIKAIHHPNGSANGGVHPGTATDGGAAPIVDPSLTSPAHSQLANGSALSAGTGAVAVNHQQAAADPSVASGIVEPAHAGTTAAPATMAQPQTVPIQPIQPSERAVEPTPINTAYPAGPQSAVGSSVEPTSAVSPTSPQQHSQLSAVAPAAAAGAAGAGAANVVAHPPATTVATAPAGALDPKEVKKMDKLMKTEAKNEHKSLKRAIKDAAASEKLFRKSRDAEATAVKRHQKATTHEHKAAKVLSKAKAEHEKTATELSKALEDLDIKKKHTETTREQYEKAKKHIDELRNQKTVNDQARSRQAAQLHGARA